MMRCLRHALLEDRDKATRQAAAKFVHAARTLIGNTGLLQYDEVQQDKRAAMALDRAKALYARDVSVLTGQSVPSEEQGTEAKANQKNTGRDKRKRKNNMRVAISAASHKTTQQGGGVAEEWAFGFVF